MHRFVQVLLVGGLVSTPSYLSGQAVVLDEGAFFVEVGGRRIGTETFRIRRMGFGDNTQVIAQGSLDLVEAGESRVIESALGAVGMGMSLDAYQVKVASRSELQVRLQRPPFCSIDSSHITTSSLPSTNDPEKPESRSFGPGRAVRLLRPYGCSVCSRSSLARLRFRVSTWNWCWRVSDTRSGSTTRTVCYGSRSRRLNTLRSGGKPPVDVPMRLERLESDSSGSE